MGDRNSIGSGGGGGGGGWLGGKGADEEMGAFGVNNFAAKQQKLDDYYDNTMNVDELKGLMVKLVQEDIPAAAKETFKTVVRGVTPGFIQRFQNRKIHVQDVEEKERYD